MHVRHLSFRQKRQQTRKTVNEAHTAIQEQCYFFQLKMAKGDSTSNVSYYVILQMGCLSGLVAIESILLVHPGSSHKAHQELISTKAQEPEAVPVKNCEAKDTSPVQFENSVISFGSKTVEVSSDVSKEFENSVIIFAVKIISDKKRAIGSEIARFSN